MKVSKCRKCKHHQRRTWSHRHESATYHPVGMSHAYAYCLKHKKRCSMVKKCKEAEPTEAEGDDYDYERASDMRDYCEMYEPTYNPEDGSM